MSSKSYAQILQIIFPINKNFINTHQAALHQRAQGATEADHQLSLTLVYSIEICDILCIILFVLVCQTAHAQNT